jgi:hypothetical protein
MKIIVLLAFLGLCTECNRAGNETYKFPATIDIDSSAYKTLANQFRARGLWAAPDHLGALNPSYPIAIINMDIDHFKDTDWMSHGMIASFDKIVVKKQNGYFLINSHAELKEIYAPITSEKEALSYAILYTRFFAVFDISFFKSSYDYFGETPTISYAKQQQGGYIVHLFSYKTFGCDHPYYSDLVRVEKNGTVKILKHEVSFEDPEKKHLCVD